MNSPTFGTDVRTKAAIDPAILSGWKGSFSSIRPGNFLLPPCACAVIVGGRLNPGRSLHPVLTLPEHRFGLQAVHQIVRSLKGGAAVRG